MVEFLQKVSGRHTVQVTKSAKRGIPPVAYKVFQHVMLDWPGEKVIGETLYGYKKNSLKHMRVASGFPKEWWCQAHLMHLVPP